MESMFRTLAEKTLMPMLINKKIIRKEDREKVLQAFTDWFAQHRTIPTDQQVQEILKPYLRTGV